MHILRPLVRVFVGAVALVALSGCGVLGAALKVPEVAMKVVGKALGMASGEAAASSPVRLNMALELPASAAAADSAATQPGAAAADGDARAADAGTVGAIHSAADINSAVDR